MITISGSDGAKQLNKLKAYKRHGQGDIYACFLKKVTCKVTEPLIIIFNKSVSGSCVVDAKIAANVTPLFKKRPNSKAFSYSPISLASVVCKMLKSSIKSQGVIKTSRTLLSF